MLFSLLIRLFITRSQQGHHHDDDKGVRARPALHAAGHLAAAAALAHPHRPLRHRQAPSASPPPSGREQYSEQYLYLSLQLKQKFKLSR